MGVREFASDMRVRVALVTCVSFLLTSAGYLSWMYRIMALNGSSNIEFLTMVCGYLAQALGIGAYVVLARHRGAADANGTRGAFGLRWLVCGSLVLYVALLVPATLTQSLAATLACGYLANVFCGVIQGFYLHCLGALVERGRRGIVFGAAYGASTLFTWVLSLPGHGALTQGLPCFLSCCVMAVACIALVWAVTIDGGVRVDGPDSGVKLVRKSEQGQGAPGRDLVALACFVVVAVSFIRMVGYSFPSSDITSDVSIEFTRLLYGVGLVVAGLASDRDRNLGMLFCLACLVMPFLMLALVGAGASGALLWALGYLLSGFYVVYRVLLMVDLAAAAGKTHLAGMGLLLGHVGDALGTSLYLALADSHVALIAVSAVVFVLTIASLFALYQRSVPAAPVPAPERSERQLLEEFVAHYGLSARERGVLPLILSGKSNSEIAGELFVTESTVKFHVRNILKKTGCESRVEVMDLFNAGSWR